MKLDEKALEAFRNALELPRWYSDDELLSAIRAYLEAATPPDVAGLCEKLEADVAEQRSHGEPINGSLVLEAATALRLSAGGGDQEEPWREIQQHVQPRIADGYTAVMISKPGFWFVKGPGPASPTVEAGHVE